MNHDGFNPIDHPCGVGIGGFAHRPKPARTVRHHLVPLSWGGADDPSNWLTVCDNHHYAIHTVIDEYVRRSAASWPVWTPPDALFLRGFDSATIVKARIGITSYAGADLPGYTL